MRLDLERLDEIHQRLPAVDRDGGALPLGNQQDPYDELIYILLSNMTRHPPRIDRAFAALRERCAGQGWSALLDVDPDELRAILEPLGFVNRRTDHLLDLVATVDERHGGDLDGLHELADDRALAELTALRGVGVKTAKCVLMYALDRSVLPVDIHVLRVAKRLGLVESDASWEQADRQLEAEVPAELKFDLHVQFVVHGRAVCRSPRPRCEACVLVDICPTGSLAPTDRAAYTGARPRPVDGP